MTYRVVQWATGNLGRPAIEGIVSHPELELVGVWVHSESKIGQDAGALADRPDLVTGVKASNDIDALETGIDLARYVFTVCIRASAL